MINKELESKTQPTERSSIRWVVKKYPEPFLAAALLVASVASLASGHDDLERASRWTRQMDMNSSQLSLLESFNPLILHKIPSLEEQLVQRTKERAALYAEYSGSERLYQNGYVKQGVGFIFSAFFGVLTMLMWTVNESRAYREELRHSLATLRKPLSS